MYELFQTLGGSFAKRKGVTSMSHLPSEEGQGLIEYSLILTLVALAVMAALHNV